MAISNYTELQTAVANWIDRDNLTSRIPEFITLAEAKFNRNLRVSQMEATTSGTLASGASTISFQSDHIALSKLQITRSGSNYILDLIGKELLIREYHSNSTGIPQAFAINGNQIQVRPIADSAYTYEISYYQKIPNLAANSTNWLLSLYPDAYLYGSLIEAAPYLKDNEDTQVWKVLYEQVIREIKSADRVDRFSGGTLKMRTV